jgi:cellulose synthase/poly-beta-1,6-N-acetylglucosamine synthase-like glycosyltransferase
MLSKGEIIAFIDGDAVPDENWLEELIKPLLKESDYVGGRINLLNTKSWLAKFLQLTRHKQFFGPEVFQDQFIGCNMAFKKTIFEVMGGFHENFLSRGDETTLKDRIQKRFKYSPAPNSIVFHERPETLKEYLSTAWKSATLSFLSSKVSGKRMNWKLSFLFIEQLFVTLFPILIFTFWFNPLIFIIPLFFSIIFLIRQAFIRSLNKAILSGLIHEYGFVKGVLGHIIFCIQLNMFQFLGRTISPFLYFFEKIVPPMTTPLSIIKKISNKKNEV